MIKIKTTKYRISTQHWLHPVIQSLRNLVTLRDVDLEEKLAKGSGPGGQSINKSVNKVHLRHIPTDLYVTCQEHRDLTSNRKLARKLLARKVEFLEKGPDSVLGRRIAKVRKRKSKAAQRSRQKYESIWYQQQQQQRVSKDLPRDLPTICGDEFKFFVQVFQPLSNEFRDNGLFNNTLYDPNFSDDELECVRSKPSSYVWSLIDAIDDSSDEETLTDELLQLKPGFDIDSIGLIGFFVCKAPWKVGQTTLFLKFEHRS